MYKLLLHQWKEKTRSPFWQKSLILNIFLGIIGLYLLLNLVVISLFAAPILLEVFPDNDVVESFTKILFYYFLFDLIIRFMFQEIPTLSIQPYLTLPIKKSTLIHYPILKSIFSFFNLIAVILILPFFFTNICVTQDLQFNIIWLVTILSLIAGNNFLNFLMKKYFSKNAMIPIVYIGITALLLYLDIAKIISISTYFIAAIYFLTTISFLIIAPILYAAICYYLVYTLLKNNAYIEDARTLTTKNQAGFTFLNNYGEIGQLLKIELKLILRNKRPRSILYLCGLFFLYGFFFYQEKNIDSDIILSLSGLLIPATFSFNYGQFLFSWESSFFDSYLANKISRFNYVKSKYILLGLSSLIGFVISLPYAYISYKIAFINAAFLFYNIGITSMIVIFISTYSKKRIDLGKSPFFDFGGISAAQYLIFLPITGIPLLIYLLHFLLGISDYYYYTIAIIGLIAMILNKYILELVTNHIEKRKYKMAVGFRQK